MALEVQFRNHSDRDGENVESFWLWKYNLGTILIETVKLWNHSGFGSTISEPF